MSLDESRPMTRIAVVSRWGESFDVDVRGHRLVVDEPVTYGGEDDGPTPSELLAAALAAAVAEAIQAQLRTRGLPFEPLAVGADFTWQAGGRRIAAIQLRAELPPGLQPEARAEALAAAERCPAWQALTQPPAIELAVEAAAPAAVG